MTKCRELTCQAEIVWLKTPNGKNMPVDAESLSEEDAALISQGHQVEYRHHDHVSHFSTCKQADLFRKHDRPS